MTPSFKVNKLFEADHFEVFSRNLFGRTILLELKTFEYFYVGWQKIPKIARRASASFASNFNTNSTIHEHRSESRWRFKHQHSLYFVGSYRVFGNYSKIPIFWARFVSITLFVSYVTFLVLGKLRQNIAKNHKTVHSVFVPSLSFECVFLLTPVQVSVFGTITATWID